MVNGIVVYRGMDRNNVTQSNIWVTDSREYAEYFAKQEYNKDGIVKSYILPSSVINNLCNQDVFEEIMTEYDLWQEVPEDSCIWDNGDEDVDYDLIHDLCFPSVEQIRVLESEGFSGYLFKYYEDAYTIMLFDPSQLIDINTNEALDKMKSIILTEDRLRQIIREEIDAINNNGQYIYHSIGNLNDLPSILRNGLKPNRWDGIFFRRDKLYNERSTALLGVRLTEENIAKYSIVSYADVCFAYKTILPSDIEIIDCRIGEGNDPQFMMASEWAEMPTKSDEICYEVFKYIGLKFLYEDICRYFFDESFIERLKSFGIKFTNLL